MKLTRREDVPKVPAGHEDPRDPGVWKRVLVRHSELRPGRVQMINWATLPARRSFAPHYHEDMQEVFIMLCGTAQITVDDVTVTLQAGDTITIDPGEVHTMTNPGADEVDYLAIGMVGSAHGKTVLVDSAS